MTVLYLISILKLAPLLLLIVIGFPAIEWARVVDSGLIAPTQLGQSMLVLMYAFIGFEFSLIAAGETRNAKATVPRALIGTVIAIALCYALIQLVAVSVGPDLGNSASPLVELARRLTGATGAIALSLGAIFSIGGGSLTSLLTAPRLTFALARDGTLPMWFGIVNERTRTPANSILFCGALSLALAVGQQFVWLVLLSTSVRLMTYALCIAALPKIEKSLPKDPGQFALPGGLVIPACGLLLTIWLLSHSSMESFAIMGIVVALGSIIYWACISRSGDAFPIDRQS
ncbi:APC family permease [Sphingobium sp. BS19]|nr:APC family permease [Sphingobium sp. BS19]